MSPQELNRSFGLSSRMSRKFEFAQNVLIGAAITSAFFVAARVALAFLACSFVVGVLRFVLLRRKPTRKRGILARRIAARRGH